MESGSLLIEILDRDGIKLKKVSYRELAGPCPWCGGRDRFRVWPEEQGGGFWCRVCNRGGDMVKYHMLTTGKKYLDACYDLGVPPRFKRSTFKGLAIEKSLPPPLAWRRNAAKVVERCHAALMSNIGSSTRFWLSKRGITEHSIRKTHLGLNTSDAFFERKVWGLSEEKNTDTGRLKTIWIPAGLVIPCYAHGDLIRIRVRRDKDGVGSRYLTVSGSSKQPMRLGCLPCVVVIESELDGFLVSQEAGDLASAVALGSAYVRPDAEIHDYLRTADLILLSLDYDEAGARQTAWWRRHYGSKIKRWPVPIGKDPGEAYQAGIDMREWVASGLTIGKLGHGLSKTDEEHDRSKPGKYQRTDDQMSRLRSLRRPTLPAGPPPE